MRHLYQEMEIEEEIQISFIYSDRLMFFKELSLILLLMLHRPPAALNDSQKSEKIIFKNSR